MGKVEEVPGVHQYPLTLEQFECERLFGPEGRHSRYEGPTAFNWQERTGRALTGQVPGARQVTGCALANLISDGRSPSQSAAINTVNSTWACSTSAASPGDIPASIEQ